MTVLPVSVPIDQGTAVSPGSAARHGVGGVRCDPVQLPCLWICSSGFSVRSQAPCSPTLRLPTPRASHDWLPDPTGNLLGGLHIRSCRSYPVARGPPMGPRGHVVRRIRALWRQGLGPEFHAGAVLALRHRRASLPASDSGAHTGGEIMLTRRSFLKLTGASTIAWYV